MKKKPWAIGSTATGGIVLMIERPSQTFSCREVVNLCVDLLRMTVEVSDRLDPQPYPPLRPFEFETVPIEPATSAAAAEISALVGEGGSIG